jgi:glucosamine 6-phosphate synthetase-like amidotransferase/phosphosugar isomerase protein
MCGIAGFCLSKQQQNKSRANIVAKQMLRDIEHRGTHATGSAYIDTKSNGLVLTKKNVTASQFIKEHAVCNSNTNAVILHTRYATQGAPTNNKNNHPIQRGNIVLTHNGHISNDSDLFKQCSTKRSGEVDSEAAAALIAFGTGTLKQKLESIKGSAALAWIEKNKPGILHLARVKSSPLWVGQSNDGSLFYGSTKQTVTNAVIDARVTMDWCYELKEGEYIKVKDGVIVEWLYFTPPKDEKKYTYNYSGWSMDYYNPAPKNSNKYGNSYRYEYDYVTKSWYDWESDAYYDEIPF